MAGFVKRLCTVSLQSQANGALAYLSYVKSFVQVKRLKQTRNGVFSMFLDLCAINYCSNYCLFVLLCFCLFVGFWGGVVFVVFFFLVCFFFLCYFRVFQSRDVNDSVIWQLLVKALSILVIWWRRSKNTPYYPAV